MSFSSFRLAGWAQKIFGPLVKPLKLSKDFPQDRIPPFNDKPFSKVAPRVAHAKGATRARAFYFHGCVTNYLYGNIGEAVLDVLSHMGVEVHIPQHQGCCGIPMVLSGAREMAFESIVRVLEDFAKKDVDAVVVDCATCGLAFRKEYPHLIRELMEFRQITDEGFLRLADLLSQKIRDVTEFIEQHSAWLPEFPRECRWLRVTYHDPCHLLKGQGVGLQIRKVLQKLPHVDLLEMEKADACCGGGGAFQVEHPEIAAAITAKKLESIYRTGAEVVVTGCPECRFTIGVHLHKDQAIRVLHPVELIQMAFKES
jgi:glycolate oxidase iron-sulfur subunit